LPFERGPDDNLREHAVRGVAWVALGNWGTQLSAFAVFVVLSHMLSARAFGLVSLATVFIGLVQVIAAQGLIDALVQREAISELHLHTAFWMSMGISSLLGLVLAALSIPIADLLGEPDLAGVLIVLSLTLPISGAGLVQRAILSRRLDFRGITLRQLVGTLIGGVMGVIAAIAGLGVWSLVVQSVANQIAGVMMVWTVTAWRPRLMFGRTEFRHLFRFGISVVGFRLLNFMNRRADDFLIGTYLGPVQLGFYSVAYRLIILLVEVSSSIIDAVAFPVFSRIQSEIDRVRRAYYTATSFAALLAFPAFAGVVVVAPQLIPVVFGERWEASVPAVRVLALFGGLQAMNYFNSTIIKSLGRPGWRVAIVAVSSVLNVTGFAIAVSHGIVAVATSLVVVSYATLPMYYYAVNRLVPIRLGDYLRCLRGPVLATLVMVASVTGLQMLWGDRGEAGLLLVSLVTGVVTYLLAIRVIAPALAAEGWSIANRVVRRSSDD
jgi:PST family polysaccharide transporter